VTITPRLPGGERATIVRLHGLGQKRQLIYDRTELEGDYIGEPDIPVSVKARMRTNGMIGSAAERIEITVRSHDLKGKDFIWRKFMGGSFCKLGATIPEGFNLSPVGTGGRSLKSSSEMDIFTECTHHY